MGSIISLGVGHLEIDWGKNEFFRNHSKLFLKGDIHPAKYYYAEGHQDTKPAYVRSLRHVLKRLALLGYTSEGCRHLYEESLRDVPDYYPDPILSFDALARVLRLIEVDRVALPDDLGDYDLGEYAATILSDPEFCRVEPSLQSLKSDDGTFFENLDPYIVLRLLADNESNLDRDVVWRFQDVLDGGWMDETGLWEGLADTDRYLVVTEGSSDSSILRAALPIVEPDVSDFFDFIDMAENYPFTGTGNLLRFCQGLASIKIQNKILVVLDNDTAGHDVLRRIKALSLPRNLRVTVLPKLDEMAQFRTLGPAGESLEDVNGKAVSIECFLDLTFGPNSPPSIRWTSFNSDLGTYQGELVNKAEYTRAFFRHVQDNSYDTTKLSHLWRFLLSSCVD
jgi:hypothetical protein